MTQGCCVKANAGFVLTLPARDRAESEASTRRRVRAAGNIARFRTGAATDRGPAGVSMPVPPPGAGRTDEAGWLRGTMARECGRFGADVELTGGDMLRVRS